MQNLKLTNSLTGTVIALVLGVFLMAPAASAATYTWTGSSGVDNNWTTNGNWDIAGSPDSGDTANIGPGATVDMDDLQSWWTITLNQSGGTVTNMTGGALGSNKSASAWHLTGGTFDLNGENINWADKDGTLNIDGGSVTNVGNFGPTAGSSFLASGSISGTTFAPITPGNTYVISGGTSTWSGSFSLVSGVDGTLTTQISGGTHTAAGLLDLNAFNIDERISILEFRPGSSGTLSVGDVEIQSDNDSRIDFIMGTDMQLDISGYGVSDYESLWDSEDLWYNGMSKTDLGGIAFDQTSFVVNGSILSIPEPSAFALLLAGFGLLMSRRRRRA